MTLEEERIQMANLMRTLEDPNFKGPIDLSFDLTQAKGGVDFKPNASLANRKKSR